MIQKKPLNRRAIEKDEKIFREQTFFGVQPSPDDPRDYSPETIACSVIEQSFPEEFEAEETDVLDQGSVGSCVAHSCALAIMQCEQVRQKVHANYSRGYIYGNRRENDYQGEGMIIREALRQLNHCGDVLYDDFKYNLRYPEVKALIEQDKENLAAKAEPHKIIEYYRCYTENDIKDAVYERGACVICIPIYGSLQRNQSKPEGKPEATGYHAVTIVGWTKNHEWIVQNSWGKDWGYKGKFFLDMDYPISEYWGVTAGLVDPNSIKKKSWIGRVIAAICGFFVKIFKK